MTKFKVFLVVCTIFCLLIQNIRSEIYYPWKNIYIGALEGKTWGGLVFAPKKNSAFAFRIKAEKGNEVADEEGMFFLISEVGPHSPDGQYARIKIDLSLPFKMGKETPILIKPPKKSNELILEWSRQDERTVIGRIKAPEGIKLHLVHYFPWDLTGKYAIHESRLKSGPNDRHVKGENSSNSGYHYLFWTNRRGDLISDSQGEALIVSYSTQKEKELYFVAGVGEEARILENHIYRYKNKKTIDSILDEEKNKYRKKRTRIEGFNKSIVQAITNNLFWMTLYQPGKHRLYTPAGRRWIFPKPDGSLDHWTIFEWDSFFNALEAAVESFKHAKDIVKAVLETQYPNGNIPNWRGQFGGTSDRSQPPVGSYVILKLFLRMGDKEFLRFAYPYLRDWHSFWKEPKANGQPRRDGNRDGLLEWGSDTDLLAHNVPPWEKKAKGKTRAMWESGQDDLPNWDEASFNERTGTLTMNCLDLNSLYALDAWCLAQIAGILDEKEDFKTYLDEYEKMKELVNQNLWDEKEGFYFDRHWNGKFSTKKAASNFYPLLARIPDQKRALRMIKRFLNPEEFWGDYVIPTISRDDPSFKDQQYWRGTIWPPTNYLVYQGLKAYHFDAIASEYAKKNTSLFIRIWKNYQLCPENFDSRTGEAGGQRYQSWGPLFALIGLEEYLDFTPWEGFRFGMINSEEKGKLSRICIHDRHYEVEVSPSEVKLKEEDKEILKANGSAIFRHFLYSENQIQFEVKTLNELKIKIRFLTKGKYQVLVDDQIKEIFKGKSIKLEIPEGEHSVLILLLEKEE